ncbi:MAG TPA: hypothetical protein PLH19_15540 [Anaerolineae bacterium]|nr:hypothetical protein [Anaerolineae bacterium]HQH39925.1 hypothetical protein [Anaerolineae bacterium]
MAKNVGRILVTAALLLVMPSLPVHAAGELPPPHLGYGMMLAYPPGNLERVHAAGFNWFKYFAYWNHIDPDRDGVYDWESTNTQLAWACDNELNLLLRVERDADDWTPIQDDEMADWQAFFQALAAHIAQRRAACGHTFRVALEIWNEPNLDFQWTGQLNPARYTEMVRRAYLGAKAGDPTLPVVAGSLAPTGGDGVHSLNDVDFLQAMYANGLAGHFDALSIHNYGFGGAPEDKTWGAGIVNFRRAEDIYAVMVAHGDGDKSVWGTEFGWLMDATAEGHPECLSYWDSIGFGWQKVSAVQQADYLKRAFAYADANWPWMGVMIVSNLDFSTTGWYGTCDPLNWFSILKPDRSPRLSYTTLAEMDKRPGVISAMSVTPAAWDGSVRWRERTIITETVTVESDSLPFAWSAVTETAGLPFAITPTLGVSGQTFQVTVDARDLLTGTYRGVITVTAADTLVTPPAIAIPLELEVWGVWGMDVHPASLSWMVEMAAMQPLSATVIVENSGDYGFEWAVTTASEALTMTVVPSSSAHTGTTFIPGAFQVLVDPRGLPVGLYTGILTVTASEAAVPESPFVLPVSVRIVERLYQVYMPLVMREYQG